MIVTHPRSVMSCLIISGGIFIDDHSETVCQAQAVSTHCGEGFNKVVLHHPFNHFLRWMYVEATTGEVHLADLTSGVSLDVDGVTLRDAINHFNSHPDKTDGSLMGTYYFVTQGVLK